MIDVSSEILLAFPETASTLPSRPHLSTIHRWRLRGVYGVKLETVMVGGRRYTSREALQRFAAATTAAASGEPVPHRTNRQRQREIAKAEQELSEARI